MHNDEHFLFYKDFKDLAETVDMDAFGIAELWEPFTARFLAEDEAFKKIIKSATTAEIKIADKARDNTFSGLVETLRGAVKHYDKTIAAAARRVKIVFDTFGNLSSMSLIKQTSGLYNLLQDLHGKYAADVKTAGLDGWVEKLETENNAVDTLLKARNAENAGKTQLKMKKCRAATDDAYYAITDRIHAMININGNAGFTEFVNQMNTVIDKYYRAIAQRAGRAKAKKKTADEQNAKENADNGEN
jgi:hypothetical protein